MSNFDFFFEAMLETCWGSLGVVLNLRMLV